ncbi:glycosyltransferase [Aliifodinibius salicampi]|uniref:Glycosyltransferase n=1 Tax=Fodinibius salicampi TaxID=1920655 RepID=A0ABT3PYY6_9BACT|nr:glycosyltransferase [Fodinibius salicampi]
MAKKVNSIEVFAPGWPTSFDDNVHHVNVLQWPKKHFYTLTYTICLIPVLVVHLIKERPDVIYARYFNLLFVIALIIRLFRVPLVVEHNADIHIENNIYNRGSLLRAFYMLSERILLKNCSGSIVVADHIVESWEKRFSIDKSKIITIRNGVDTNIYKPGKMLYNKKVLSLDMEKKHIVYVGSFVQYQGLHTLIKAFRIVVQKYPNVSLILVGGTTSQIQGIKDQIQSNGIKNKIKLYEKVDEPTAAKFVNAANICVAPYNKEVALPDRSISFGTPMKGDPLKIYSYMACERPIVATYYREAGYLLEKIGAGVSVPPEKPEALAKALLDLLADESKCREKGKKGREYVSNNATWQVAAKKTVGLLSSIIEKNNK